MEIHSYYPSAGESELSLKENIGLKEDSVDDSKRQGMGELSILFPNAICSYNFFLAPLPLSMYKETTDMYVCSPFLGLAKVVCSPAGSGYLWPY